MLGGKVFPHSVQKLLLIRELHNLGFCILPVVSKIQSRDAACWVEWLPSVHKTLSGFRTQDYAGGTMVHACNHSSQPAEMGESQMQGHSGLRIEPEASLSYMRHCLKTEKRNAEQVG